MNTGRVSVVIPVFNSEQFLGEAIESVLVQGDEVLEVLVVDDGSTDGSAAVAERFGEPVRVIRQDNRGPAAARRHGYNQRTGSNKQGGRGRNRPVAGRRYPVLHCAHVALYLQPAHGSGQQRFGRRHRRQGRDARRLRCGDSRGRC
jgi:glycosyltransferase involved in cell wall biosynthesis